MNQRSGEPVVRLRCRYCGDVIGVYDPLVALLPGGALRTSLVIDPDLVTAGYACFHLNCYELLHEAG